MRRRSAGPDQAWMPGGLACAVSAVAAGAAMGAVLGIAAELAKTSPLAVVARAALPWSLAGLVAGAGLTCIRWLGATLANALGRVYLEEPGPHPQLCAAVVGAGFATPLVVAARELAGRPLLMRLLPDDSARSVVLVAGGLIAAIAIGAALARTRGRLARTGLLIAGVGVVVGASQINVPPVPVLRHVVLFAALLLATAAALPTAAFRRRPLWIAVLLPAAILAVPDVTDAAYRHTLTNLIAHHLAPAAAARTVSAETKGRWQAHFGRHRSGLGAELDAAVPDRRDLDVLWITVCTYRRDRLGLYGNQRGLTPNVDRLGGESVVFERGYSTFPASAHAITSMFTARYPTHTSHYLKKVGRLVPSDEPWFPTTLRDAGRATWALTALSDIMRRGPGFRQSFRGFDVRNPYEARDDVQGSLIADAFVKRLRAQPTTQPFFAWVHLMDPHSPYVGEPDLGSSNQDRYDGDIRVCDRALGRIFDAVRETGRWDRTVVVLHGDHGEEFGEHGGLFHYRTVYEEQVGVPFLVRVPGVAPRRVTTPSDITDLAPTIADLLDVDFGRGHGDSLVPLLLGRPLPSFAFSEVVIPFVQETTRRMIVGEDGLKLVVRGSFTGRELYDLAADPGETDNLAGRGDPRETTLSELLDAVVQLPVATGATERPAAESDVESPVAAVVREVLESASSSVGDLEKALLNVPPDVDTIAPRVRALLAHRDVKVRVAATTAAVRLGLRDVRPVLFSLLEHADRRLRIAATRALGSLGEPGDAARLTVDENTPPNDILARARSREALGDHGGWRAAGVWLHRVPPSSRYAVLAELTRLGDPDARDTVRRALDIPDLSPSLRLAALSAALQDPDEATYRALETSLDAGLLTPAMVLLALPRLRADDRRAVPTLLRLSRHRSDRVRLGAARLLRDGDRDVATMLADWHDVEVLDPTGPYADRRTQAQARLRAAGGYSEPGAVVATEVGGRLAALRLPFRACAAALPLVVKGRLTGAVPGPLTLLAEWMPSPDGSPGPVATTLTIAADGSADFAVPLRVFPATDRAVGVRIGWRTRAGPRWYPTVLKLVQ
ncbi:MAG: hypothetical protein CMJ83_02405 [Planctomycetes bacterium]|nr:hypothetical protein [Planctomycetota bacterium]